MPITNRIQITRRGRRIGFLEVPGFPQTEASLPYFEGVERGFAIVVEIEAAPVAALIFPSRGESIDIAEPIQWSAERSPEHGDQLESGESLRRHGLREALSLFQLAGEIRPDRTEGEQYFEFHFRQWQTSAVRRLPIRF